jgi:hypothetical protein|tara:strand:- start:494 stop:1225 length:732 start_codon:yes stop_codon:yes gene_type:complete
MINIEEIYQEYLNHLRVENKEKYKDHKGWFSASSAGSCYRKMIYRTMDIDTPAPDVKSNRLLRLGTILHNDFEKSITRFKNHNDIKYQIVTEHRIELPEINVVGHLDIGIISKDKNKIKIYDLKSCGAWKWRMKFGRKPDKNPSTNYELQVGTYGMGLGREYGITDIDLNLLWYNKDTSAMREENINSIWIEEAFEYWTDLNEVVDSISKPEELTPSDPNVPIYSWECKYCEYKDTHCPGVYS